MPTKKIAFFPLLPLSFFLLAGCSEPQENPEEVMQKFKQASIQIESGVFSVGLLMKGSDAQDNLDFTGDFDIKFDRREGEERKAEVGVKLEGVMQADGRSLSGDIALGFRSLGDDFYLRLDQFESSDASLKILQPFIQAYTGRWLRLAPELIPEQVRGLQNEDEAALAQEKELKTLFVDTGLFTVVKEYGIETVNGQKSYHYGLRLNEEGVQEYLRASAELQGQPLNDEQVQESTRLLASILETQVWVGVKDYYLYKGLVKFKGAPDSGVDMQAEINLEANSYNENVKIEAPKDAEEFNPLALLGGMAAPAVLDENQAEVQ